MTTDPAEFEKSSRVATEAHRRSLAEAIANIEVLRSASPAEIPDGVDQAIQGARDFAEVMFGTIRMQSVALLALMHEIAADRRVTLLMIAALLGQNDVDREELHADFLNRAAKSFGGPESFPLHAREAAIVLLGKVPD